MKEKDSRAILALWHSQQKVSQSASAPQTHSGFPQVREICGFRPPSRGCVSVFFGACIEIVRRKLNQSSVVEEPPFRECLTCLVLFGHCYISRLIHVFLEATIALLHLSIHATSVSRYSNINTNNFLSPQNFDRTLVLLNMNNTRKECGGQISTLAKVENTGLLHSHSIRKILLSPTCVQHSLMHEHALVKNLKR